MAQVQITTNCSVKNKTSSSMAYHTCKDWQGTASYPNQILSLVEISFLHTGNLNSSEGAVVYRIKKSNNKSLDIMVAWYAQSNSSNKAYTLVKEIDYFTAARWDEIKDSLEASSKNSTCTYDGCTSEVEIDDKSAAKFSAKISFT
ncbi:jasmonate-induced protein homolog [Durio zibethinus]|uniref:Jasmonate-induced protein homolog n=1 Tax=Durio zibethinus TaxID=66656 RepID=A0A6P5YW98_DURZI|nr:jasmonate-induced protein homolog [Durio zibethinus]